MEHETTVTRCLRSRSPWFRRGPVSLGWVLVATCLSAMGREATAQSDFLFDAAVLPADLFDAGLVDLDGNGRLDLVRWSGAVGGVTVRYQQPDGSFEPELLAAKQAVNYTVGNMVGDELPDIVW